MTKNDAIRAINVLVGSRKLSHENTHWANVITYSSREGWWLNVPFHKFSQDLHLILNSAMRHSYLHIAVPANSIALPTAELRNKEGSADIFMPSAGRDRLIDVQSGSNRHNFSIYEAVEHTYR